MSTATSFTVGDSVVVDGLVNREELNHRIGRVIGYDQDADRYSVKLWMSPGEQISVRIRPRNLLPPRPITQVLIQPGLPNNGVVEMKLDDMREDLLRMTHGVPASQIRFNLQMGLYLYIDQRNFHNPPDGFRTPVCLVQYDMWDEVSTQMVQQNGLVMHTVTPRRVLPFNRYFDWNGYRMCDDNPIIVEYICFQDPSCPENTDERQCFLSKLLTDTHGLQCVFLYARLTLE
jgi:hypothetical protein